MTLACILMFWLAVSFEILLCIENANSPMWLNEAA